MSKYKFRVLFLNATIDDEDPERAILPTLVYTEESGDGISARMISIGWWAWGIGFVWYNIRSK